MNTRLLTIDQVAEYLGVHRDTVASLIRSGRLAALQLGGRKAGWRISEDDLTRFVAEGKARTASDATTAERALAEFDNAQSKELEAFEQEQSDKRRHFLEKQNGSRLASSPPRRSN